MSSPVPDRLVAVQQQGQDDDDKESGDSNANNGAHGQPALLRHRRLVVGSELMSYRRFSLLRYSGKHLPQRWYVHTICSKHV